jgi:hypothetical protein
MMAFLYIKNGIAKMAFLYINGIAKMAFFAPTIQMSPTSRVTCSANTLVYKHNDLNRDWWSPRFCTLRDKKRLDSSQNGLKFEHRRVLTPFLRLSDPDSQSFSRVLPY